MANKSLEALSRLTADQWAAEKHNAKGQLKEIEMAIENCSRAMDRKTFDVDHKSFLKELRELHIKAKGINRRAWHFMIEEYIVDLTRTLQLIYKDSKKNGMGKEQLRLRLKDELCIDFEPSEDSDWNKTINEWLEEFSHDFSVNFKRGQEPEAEARIAVASFYKIIDGKDPKVTARSIQDMQKRVKHSRSASEK